MTDVAALGLFESHLTVGRLETSVRFYRDVVGLELAYRMDDPLVAFFWIGGRGHSMLGLWEIGSAPNTMSLHVAVACTLEDVLRAPALLRQRGVVPLGFFGEPVDEPVVIGWMPAVSLYFRDPDNHLLEYISMLADAPDASVGVTPYSAWERAHIRPSQPPADVAVSSND